MNDLRKLENLEKEIYYFEKMLKENDSSDHLKKYYKEILQEINEEVRSLKKTLDVSVVENKITTYNGLNELFESFPENRRRKVNKIMQRGDYFNLVYNLKEEKMTNQKKNEIVYSTIPYDTGRNTPIEEIPNLYRERKGGKIKFTVEKTIKGKRFRKRFDEINLAIDYLNKLKQSTSVK
ncbi:hypothetical protein F4V47_05465 [Lactococcus garvieae subsp. garvieae]|uniref:hypothetical protein n=1 Tax=Lactococcus garvieae TaxID=1363 RepID=UPI000AC987B5|nr:hypothetical protein [Lactococcus garvieae]KAA8713787.1 hypothetical protein F4V47_05465 [Lactococcus garvieae subsp. garvieae]MDG6190406.1 hypothetical protein [Lactococcus garvieae]QPR48297.1 hypothetical protein I6G86_06880 [Lactococcus garvieae]